jgi:hypothetical protein
MLFLSNLKFNLDGKSFALLQKKSSTAPKEKMLQKKSFLKKEKKYSINLQ